VKSDIDALLKEYEENWMNFVFSDQPEICRAFKEKQVYQAMLIMATINAKCHITKNPVVSTKQEGWDLIFTWEYENQYYLHLAMIVPWEGNISYEINTFEEGDADGPMRYGDWAYTDFTRVDSQEVSDFAEHLNNATEKDCKHEWGTDGQHSNEFCKKCFVNKPEREN